MEDKRSPQPVMGIEGANLAYEEMLEAIRVHTQIKDITRIKAAYDFAFQLHGQQLRKDGSLYITHPLKVAAIVAEMGLDEDSIVAAILHDVIEDTPATHEDIVKRFGESVADIVEGVTKLTRVTYTTKEEEQMENLRKMFLAMAKDIRVILIKIADRLHNMRTMDYQTAAKQREKSLETMEIYAPIAHRLGMQKIKLELEDLALVYLDPVGYEEIEKELVEDLLSCLARDAKNLDVAGCISVFYHYMDEGTPVQQKLLCDPDYVFFYNKVTQDILDSDFFQRFYVITENPSIVRAFCVGITSMFRTWYMEGKKIPLEELISYAGRLMTEGYNGIPRCE